MKLFLVITLILIGCSTGFAAKGGNGGKDKPPRISKKPVEVTYYLTWEASTTPDVDGYHVYRDTVSPFIVGNYLDYYVTLTKKPSDVVCFWVTAYKGTQESPPSNTVCK